jgi:FMN phosphatase YigB (HAD superfamily)
LVPIKAVIFDFIGTLTKLKGYDQKISEMKLYRAIVNAGFRVDPEVFLKAYRQAHVKYRVVRYQKLTEVANAVWVSEALSNLGFKTSSKDSRVKTAVNLFFEDYLNSLKLRRCGKRILKNTAADHKLGLMSNFTYAPVIYAALRRLTIKEFFDAVLVSEATGWRKPHLKIFEEALKRLGVSANQTVYVGDSPLEDIKGASLTGIKTVFVPSQFYSLRKLHESLQTPDVIVNNVCELCKKLPRFIKNVP